MKTNEMLPKSEVHLLDRWPSKVSMVDYHIQAGHEPTHKYFWKFSPRDIPLYRRM